MKSATRITASTFGALFGIAGIEHGIGEILQGNFAPDGLMFPSWPGEGPFRVLGGELALTILPSLLVAGLLSVLVSLVFIAWVVRFIESKHGSAVLALLPIVMLLVGGGLFPPLFGIMLAVVGTRIHSFRSPEYRRPRAWRIIAARIWPWSLGVGLFTWLLMMPGLPLAYCFGLAPDDKLIYTVMLSMIGFPFSTIFTGFAFDSIRQSNALVSGGVQNQLTSPAASFSKG